MLVRVPTDWVREVDSLDKPKAGKPGRILHYPGDAWATGHTGAGPYPNPVLDATQRRPD